MSALPDFLDEINRILQDDSEVLKSPEKERFLLKEALQQYSKHRPYRKVADVSATSSYSYEINSTNFPSWVDGFSDIINVEYPAGEYQDPRDAKVPFEEFEIYQTSSAKFLRFTRVTPSSGKTIRSTYTIPHSITSSTSTIYPNDFGALCNLASAYCSSAIARYYAQTSNSTIGADAVAYRDKSDIWASRSKDLLKMYIDFMFPKELSGALAFREFDTIYGELQYSRLTHKEWAR